MKPRVLLSWSSGKDSAWALHTLRQDPEVEVVGLLTSVSEAYGRVTLHSTRPSIVEAQARAAGLPLYVVRLPTPCPNQVYEAVMRHATADAVQRGVTHVAFGALFLEDVRTYRIRQLQGVQDSNRCFRSGTSRRLGSRDTSSTLGSKRS